MNRKINPNKIIILILILSLVIIALGLKLSGIFDSDPDGVDRISEASPTESSLKIAEKIRKQKSIDRFDRIVIASDGNNSNLISAACLAMQRMFHLSLKKMEILMISQNIYQNMSRKMG